MRRLVFVVIALAAGCHARSDVPPCETVAGQFFTIANRDLETATVDPATHRAVAEQLPAMRDALAIACKDGAWAPAVRTCMVAATDHTSFQACEQQLTNPQRAALDRAARGDTP